MIKFKNNIKFGLLGILITLVIVFFCQADNPKREKPIANNAEEFINLIDIFQIEYIETVYLRWNSVPRFMPRENENHWLPLKLRWDDPSGYLYDLRDALKKFPFKETKGEERVHFTIRFYLESYKEVFRISLAWRHPAIMINGKAYEPTPEIMKSLKYLMPHLAYDEISNSSVYKTYFIEEPKEEQNEKEEGDTIKKAKEEIKK